MLSLCLYLKASLITKLKAKPIKVNPKLKINRSIPCKNPFFGYKADINAYPGINSINISNKIDVIIECFRLVV